MVRFDLRALRKIGLERWPGKTAHGDKWIFCLTAAIVPHDRRANEQTTTPEPQPGFQSEGGLGCRQGREDAGVKGEKTLAELAQLYDVHANQITSWRTQLLEGAAGVFGSDSAAEAAEPAIDVKTLHAKIGELTPKSFWA